MQLATPRPPAGPPPRAPTPRTPAGPDATQTPLWSTSNYVPSTPEERSARKKTAHQLVLTTETRIKEEALAHARKLSARRQLDAKSLALATAEQEALLSHERRLALAPRPASTVSSKTPWRDDIGEMAARSRAVILEALRASQRREEAVAKSLDAERIERILELRDRELRASLRDAMAKRRAFAQQQEEWLEHQRLMAAAKSQKIESDQEAKERARLEIEEAALAFKAKREKQVAKRKAESAAAKERAEKRKQEYLRQRAEEMAKDHSARNEREEVRQFERAVEHARRKHMVYEEAVVKLVPLAIARERLEKKADLIREEDENALLPTALVADLDRAAKRHEAMVSRVQDLKLEAERAANDAIAIKKRSVAAAATAAAASSKPTEPPK